MVLVRLGLLHPVTFNIRTCDKVSDFMGPLSITSLKSGKLIVIWDTGYYVAAQPFLTVCSAPFRDDKFFRLSLRPMK